MKKLLLIVLLVFISCTEKIDKQISISSDPKKEKEKKKEQSIHKKFYAKSDTVFIQEGSGDTLVFTKEAFNQVIDKHSEFFRKYDVSDPDKAYHNERSEGFTTEAGQDYYYLLYAHFLRERNGRGHETKRKKLREIFWNINALFQKAEYGGTFFGHQHQRIPAYAEYILHTEPEDEINFQKTYSVTEQKRLYLESLRQLIRDVISIDIELRNRQQKRERSRFLNKNVQALDTLITDLYYLRKAQEYHYRFYSHSG